MNEALIGKPLPRFEDAALVAGKGRFVDDIVLPGMLFGFVLRSGHAHADILSIDTAEAKRAPGVVAVLTNRDWQAAGYGVMPRPKPVDDHMYLPAYPGLAGDRVRWVGDSVAFVVAETLAQAMDAAEMIDVSYRPLPPVTDPVVALMPDAPLVWDGCRSNICFTYRAGDEAAVDDAFARAAFVVAEDFRINRVIAAAIEPRGCVGEYCARSERYTLHTPLQRPFSFRTDLAKTMGVAETLLRVVATDIGGSFGMKGGVYNEAPLVLLAAKLAGRPVKWVASRSDSFLSDAHGRDLAAHGELALNRDGRFLGLKVSTTANLGAYVQTGAQSTPMSNLGTLAGVYATPAIQVETTAVFTHTNPLRPYRGNGRPEAAYIIERLVDIAADEIGMDPAELRRRNTIRPDQMPFTTGLTFTYDCGDFARNLDQALAEADYGRFEARREQARARGKLRGIGIANTVEQAALRGYEGAEIRVDRSGHATLLCGAVSQGQGHETVFRQIVHDRLGIAADDVRVVTGDTDAVFFGEGTGSSRTAALGGSAVALAADRLLAKAHAIAAHLMHSEAVTYDRGIFNARDSNLSATLAEIAQAAAVPGAMPSGLEPGLSASAVYESASENYPNGCHVCELEIDEQSGHVDILHYVVVDDVGTVLNPLLVDGQLHGGIAQGIGQVLMEDIHFDEATGQLLTGSFMDYAMPRAGDLGSFETASNPVPTATNPLGVKGAGELGCVGALPATMNAIVDALSVLGIRHVEMPATPQRLWRAMKQAKQTRRDAARPG